MPVVTVRILKEDTTAEQKAQVIEGITQVLEKALRKDPAKIIVMIDEVEADNMGVGGQSMTERRKPS
ncbi:MULTISPECIES: 2-hydroxymuconate tautomerase family protein [Lonsdalea]|uniref:Tautomerase n=2 Tax=Lonsdalea TaxID=1082702 RepID=A0ACD1JFM6_9GAMM|nr:MULTISPECIES: 2-hydroxymuconate tautomerase family protein [Lonsdalea]OSM95222.1 tautomerase [Lonsdalea populi]OSN01397.1 tautomerase [Lonsdalea populi]QPQ24122.1 2-hydroxymuconate tautomerase family protein [Lonsdalea populi]RAT15425.1 tautomerase [Lonsdalea quercina]RAT15754.1 tautomerase [Lonsdalea quercina]